MPIKHRNVKMPQMPNEVETGVNSDKIAVPPTPIKNSAFGLSGVKDK